MVFRFGGMTPAATACLKRLAQERREQVVFLARGLDVPLAVAGPVLIGLRIGLDLLDEARLVDAGHGEHHGGRHHLLRAESCGSAPRRARRRRHRPWHRSRARARIASRPDLLSVMTPRIDAVLHDGRDAQAVQHGCRIRLLHQHVGDVFEHLAHRARWLIDCGSGIAAPMALARCSNSMPMPSQSTVRWWRYQAKPSTPT